MENNFIVDKIKELYEQSSNKNVVIDSIDVNSSQVVVNLICQIDNLDKNNRTMLANICKDYSNSLYDYLKKFFNVLVVTNNSPNIINDNKLQLSLIAILSNTKIVEEKPNYSLTYTLTESRDIIKSILLKE